MQHHSLVTFTSNTIQCYRNNVKNSNWYKYQQSFYEALILNKAQIIHGPDNIIILIHFNSQV